MNVGQTLSALPKPRLNLSGLKELGDRLPLDNDRLAGVREFVTLPAIPATAEHVLVLYGQQLLLPARRMCQPIAETESADVYPAFALAEAARQLLPNIEGDDSVCVCLPAYEFVATHLNLPGVGQQSVSVLENAVRLQLPNLLPGFTNALLLAVKPSRWVNPEGDYVALWLPDERAEALHSAFAEQGLNLAMITPRPLASLVNETMDEVAVFDEDEETLTYVHWSGGAVQQWLHIAKEDYIADETFHGEFGNGNFHKQLHELIDADSGGAPEIHRATIEDWLHAAQTGTEMYHYRFIPNGARRQIEAARKQKKQLWQKVVGFSLLGMIVLAVLFIWGNEFYLKWRLSSLQERTAQAGKLRTEVLEIEDTLAPINQFPRQDVVAMLEKLNSQIPKDSWLTNIEVDAGEVELRGYSPKAAEILEILSALPEYEDVTFTGSIQNDRQGERFSIGLRLSGIDVPSYLAEHFQLEE